MTISQEKIEQRMEKLKKVCRDAGIKLTHQRMEIFREVAQSFEHPDAEAVYSGVRKRLPSLSLDTVYRALWLLKDLGLIATLGAPRERTRFDANLSRHHHFVCSKCGLTRDFYSDEFDELKLPESLKSLGRVDGSYVEVRGLCLQCVAKDKLKTNNKKEAKS